MNCSLAISNSKTAVAFCANRAIHLNFRYWHVWLGFKDLNTLLCIHVKLASDTCVEI